MNRKKGESYRRKERIGKREDIERLFRRGSRFHSKQYTLILLKNDLDCVRLAVSVGKRVGGSAVRNYEKRVCREFFRREEDEFGKGIDALIIVKRRTDSFHRSCDALRGLFNRGFHSYLVSHGT